MKRTASLAAMALLPLTFASSADAESERSSSGLRSFVGLRGDALRSINCSRDGSCTLAVTDSVITLCGGGPAFAGGTGGLDGDELVSPEVVLTRPDGTEAKLAVSYARDPLNRTLVETAVVGDRTLPNIVFHKISR